MKNKMNRQSKRASNNQLPVLQKNTDLSEQRGRDTMELSVSSRLTGSKISLVDDSIVNPSIKLAS